MHNSHKNFICIIFCILKYFAAYLYCSSFYILQMTTLYNCILIFSLFCENALDYFIFKMKNSALGHVYVHLKLYLT